MKKMLNICYMFLFSLWFCSWCVW